MSLEGHLLKRLRVRHLELMQILSTARTVREASQQMNLSQPAVTRMIQEVEELFGAELFKRSARGIIANHIGHLVIERSSLILEELLSTAREVSEMQIGRSGLIRIGTFSGAMPLALSLKRMQESFQDFAAEIHEGQINYLIGALLEGTLDCVVGSLPPDEIPNERIDQLNIKIISDDGAAVVGLRESLESGVDETDWMKLRDMRWVLPPRQSLLRQAFVRMFLELGVDPPSPIIEAMSPLTIRSLVSAGIVDLGLMRWSHAREEAVYGIIKIVDLEPRLSLPPLVVLTRRTAKARSEIVGGFIEAFRATMKSELG